jgi:hypothetical protein
VGLTLTGGGMARDMASYTTGLIGHHNVALVHMPNMGKVAAATAAGCLRASFPDILALVGVSAPFGIQPSEDILLARPLPSCNPNRAEARSRIENKTSEYLAVLRQGLSDMGDRRQIFKST